MSDFAFRMSSKDRKMAMGEKISPADDIYDPEGEEYPDPLSEPDSFVQKLLQDINSIRRNEEFSTENKSEFESILNDFITTCSDPELGPEDLPGTSMIISVLNTQDKNNGISTFGKVQKQSIIPALAPLIALAPAAGGFGLGGAAAAGAGGGLMSALGAGLSKLIPFAGRGLSWEAGKSALGMLNPFGGGDDAPTQPIETMNTVSPGYTGTTSNNRYEMPFDHITDNLMFESASGIKKKDSDIESLRAQVNAALQQWAKSGEVTENRAVWWALYSYAHEAETVAELASILTAVPEEFHNSVLNSPVGIDEQAPEPGNTGLPEPSEPSGAISPTDTSMSPVPIDGVGTPPKMPQNQSLIPGAIAASHDSLRIKPVFASVDETVFENYAEEDRPILARVAAFMNAKTHESDIIETLHPSYGHEYVIWAIEEAKKVANNDPTVDPSIVNLGIDWKEAANDPHDLPEGMHQMDIMEVLEDVKREKKEKDKKNKKFPEKGERVGPNEDKQVNQQATSQMITPQQEKTAEFVTMDQNLQHDEDAVQVEPTIYLSRKLSYPFAFMTKMIQDQGDFTQASQKNQEIKEFLIDYVENYLETGIRNSLDIDKLISKLPEGLQQSINPENRELAEQLIDEMVEQQKEAIGSLVEVTEELNEAFEWVLNAIPQDIINSGNQTLMIENLENKGIDPNEWNQAVQSLIAAIGQVTSTLVNPVSQEIGFGPSDQDKSFKYFQESGEYADPRHIIKEPEDYELDERDEELLNQMGIGFPVKSNLKESDYTSIPNSNLAQTPSPYSAAYNQTMGLAQQVGSNPILTQQAYQSGKDATPDPGVFGQLQQQQEEDEKLQEMYPNVPTDMARQWTQRQQQQQQTQGHPNERQYLRQSPAGQVATQTTSQLPAATTANAKSAAWKDTQGNILNQGQMYKMTSSDYDIPDLVRVVNNGTKLDLYIPRGDIDVSLSESEIKNSNYKFEPINEKESSFLSESMLSTNEQRALIEENGTARNIDRLNLEGTHYPPLLIQTSKNDKIDLKEIPLQDFFVEDLDLFI